MFGKRSRGYEDDEVPPPHRLRANINSLFLSNEVSGERTQSLLNDAAAAGVAGVGRPRSTLSTNLCRDLRRRLSKQSTFPPLYEASIRVWNKKRSQVQYQRVPMLLPHELVFQLFEHGEHDALLDQRGMGAATLDHVRRTAAKMDVRPDSLLAVGVWQDGVPCNWDRSETLEVLSLNLPGLSGRWRHMRLPLFVIQKSHVAKQHTFEDVFAIIAWSMRHLALGIWPRERHDDAAFGTSDSQRKRRSGQDFSPRGILAEVRGDWSMLKHTFGFPGWNEVAGCCWKCRVTPTGIRETSSTAAWRNQRLTHADFITRQYQQSKLVSKIFSAPYVETCIFRIDWLHAVDQGVAADFMGNLFWLCLDKYPGANRKVPSIGALWWKSTNVQTHRSICSTCVYCPEALLYSGALCQVVG